MSVNSKMTAIADAIREKTGGTDLLGLDDMAAGVGEVYEAGKEAVLKAFTNNFARTDYSGAFTFTDFTGYTFPETKIAKGNNIFLRYQGEYLPSGFDLSELTEISTATGTWTFMESPYLKYCPDIKLPVCPRYGGTWAACYVLETIEIVKVDENSIYDGPFTKCWALKNITFEGVIGQNISFSDSPLTAESIVSIVEHLSDTSTGKTLTLKQWAVNNADWSTTDYADWATLIATKTNWTFSLV